MEEAKPALDTSRTFHANQAVELSDLINLKFSPHRFGTDNPRYVRIREPDGPSTDGGRKARQAVLLTGQNEDESHALVCGFVDVVNRTADLKAYPVIKAKFENRYHKDLDLTRGEYNRFLDMLQEFLDAQLITTTIQSDPRRSTSAISHTDTRSVRIKRKTSPLPWIAIAMAFGFGFFTCYLLMRFGLLA